MTTCFAHPGDGFRRRRGNRGARARAAERRALATFTGFCRDEGGTLAALEIECYPDMAQAEITRLAAEAENRWPLDALLIIHRYGLLHAGDAIVLVATASAHRAEFFAARFS